MTRQIQLLKKYGLSVRGERGQHLMIDENIQRKFVEFVSPKLGETIIEIGPGLGAITELLLKSGANVVAIEQDKRFVEILEGELARDYSNLALISSDVLKVDLSKFVRKNKMQLLKVVGNIPYYITSEILLHLIKYRQFIDCAFLTVQRELADRFFAQPGSKAYGRLSLLVRFYLEPRRLFEISRNCFSPKPDVDSTSIQLTFHRKLPEGVNENVLFGVIKAAFGERRKNILNALSNGLAKNVSKDEVKKLLSASGIDFNARAEQLMLKDFIRLSQILNRDTSHFSE